MFTKVAKKSVANDVIDQIVDSVRRGALSFGDKLPSEHELAERFGVGRSSVREALKALEVLGLIRRSHDGAIINEAYPREGLSWQLYSELVVQQIDIIHLYKARRVLEVELGKEAAKLIDADDVAALHALCDRMEMTSREQLDEYVTLDRLLHQKISEIGGNPFLSQVWQLTYDLFLEMRLKIGLNSEDLAVSDERHRVLVHALAERDEDLVEGTIIDSLAIGEKSMMRAVSTKTPDDQADLASA